MHKHMCNTISIAMYYSINSDSFLIWKQLEFLNEEVSCWESEKQGDLSVEELLDPISLNFRSKALFLWRLL